MRAARWIGVPRLSAPPRRRHRYGTVDLI